MQPNQVVPYQRWRWAGDEIVPNPIVPAARIVPGSEIRRYEIDAREFLTIEGNAVIRKQLEELVESLSSEDRALFAARTPGAFDHRAACVADHVARRLRYIQGGRGFDHWLFPEEALAQGGGDCEDLAFCLASLLEASGISSYCLRVAFGSLRERTPGGALRSWDHAWVVYMNEGGAWQILEPMALASPDPPAERSPEQEATPREREIGDVEYVPYFVLNRHHLWRVRNPHRRGGDRLADYLAERSFWDGFDPSFGSSVHNSIFDEALAGMKRSDLATVKNLSFAIDVRVDRYDPRDHFDFAYIPEGWARIQARLATGKLKDFACAAHSIGDFYAHTNYADYAPRRPGTGAIIPYDPRRPALKQEPVYDFFKYQPLPGCTMTADQAAARWRGHLISGQWWRWYSTYPDELEGPAELALRRALPDHDQIAVDKSQRPDEHRAYDEAEFQIQFADRRRAAVEHIRAAYQAWRR
jgi:hypothetical protein